MARSEFSSQIKERTGTRRMNERGEDSTGKRRESRGARNKRRAASKEHRLL